MKKVCERVELPGSRLYGKQFVNVSRFSLRDVTELTLSQKKVQMTENDGIVDSSLLNETILHIINRNIDINVSDLTLQDFLFMAHWHRINSYDLNPHVVNYNCGHCGKSNRMTLTADTMIIKDIHPDYQEWNPVKLSFGGVNMRLPTVLDELDYRQAVQEGSEVSHAMWITASCMEAYGKEGVDEHLKLLELGTADDAVTIQEFRQKYDYGVSNLARTKCQHCGGKVRVPVRLALTEFLPEHISDLLSSVPSE